MSLLATVPFWAPLLCNTSILTNLYYFSTFWATVLLPATVTLPATVPFWLLNHPTRVGSYTPKWASCVLTHFYKPLLSAHPWRYFTAVTEWIYLPPFYYTWPLLLQIELEQLCTSYVVTKAPITCFISMKKWKDETLNFISEIVPEPMAGQLHPAISSIKRW